MKVVAFAMRKGGVGKSTLSQALAVAAQAAGIKTALIDMDTQTSSVKWSKRRKKEHNFDTPITIFSTDDELGEQIQNAKEAGIQLVVIDTQGGHSGGAIAAYEKSDLIIAPMTPQFQVAEQIPNLVRNCKAFGVPIAGVLSMCAPNAPSQLIDAHSFFESHGIEPTDVAITRRIVHDRAGVTGLTAAELEPESKAAQEIADLLKWVLKRLFLKGLKNG